jgi:hypothetical protein
VLAVEEVPAHDVGTASSEEAQSAFEAEIDVPTVTQNVSSAASEAAHVPYESERVYSKDCDPSVFAGDSWKSKVCTHVYSGVLAHTGSLNKCPEHVYCHVALGVRLCLHNIPAAHVQGEAYCWFNCPLHWPVDYAPYRGGEVTRSSARHARLSC